MDKKDLLSSACIVPMRAFLVIGLLSSSSAIAVTHYVDLNSPDPQSPYASWETAAITIQDAVDAASSGDMVLVTDGVYSAGGDTIFGSIPHRVSVSGDIAVHSVNGRDKTFIVGQGPMGSGATRGVYLAPGSSLVGFTVTNGHTGVTGSWQDDYAGGIWCDQATVSNCVIVGNSANSLGGGIYSDGGVVVDCVVSGNTCVGYGGGGGIYCEANGTIIDSVIENNTTDWSGDGAGIALYAGGTVQNCTVKGNYDAMDGGGIYIFCHTDGIGNQGAVRNCKIIGNTADFGGGVCFINGGEMVNSLVVSNTSVNGGGVYCGDGGALKNCTVADNSAVSGGGVYCNGGGAIKNTIIYSNDADFGTEYKNFPSGSLYSHCCTTPDPGGPSNITTDPQFAGSAFHVISDSPCIDAGTNLAALVDDLDGTLRPLDGNNDGVAIPDIGAYEFLNRIADSDGDMMSDGFEADYGLDPTDDSDADGNLDNDSHSNIEEYFADTIPTDADSVLSVIGIVPTNGGFTVTWKGGEWATQHVESCSNLLESPPVWSTIWTNLPKTPITNSIPIPSGAGGPMYYRLKAGRN